MTRCGEELALAASPADLVLVADRDSSARERLGRELTAAGFAVVEAATGKEALALVHAHSPALVILEVPLDGISGYEVCRSLREEFGQELPVMFLSGVRTESYDRVAGLLLGADDYLVKPYALDELLIRARRLIERTRTASPTLAQLTPRELEVLRLLVEGLSAREVAARLFISEKTVGTHVEHVLSKLNVKSRVQAVAVAFREGLASPGATVGVTPPSIAPSTIPAAHAPRRRRGKR
jgi:DNA-binding NarL/FixJ family response regulator